MPDADILLVEQIRAGSEAAWNELISRFEGRLQAFVESRLKRRDVAEDVVQESLIGFLNSLPNYDASRSLEGYLFSIAAHKLTDHLRREGRRPAIPFSAGDSSSGGWDLPSSDRRASTILRSGERRELEAVRAGSRNERSNRSLARRCPVVEDPMCRATLRTRLAE